MASTVFQLTLTIVVITMTVAAIPTRADEISCNAVTTCQLGKAKFIVKTTVTPSPYHESQKANYPTYRIEVRNRTAIKHLYDDTETTTSESTTRAPHCSIKEAADVELGVLLDAREDAMVTLVAGETRLMAHRAVLAARSSVFAAMLCRGSQEASSSEVVIPDVEGPVLRQLLAYLYTQQMPQLSGMAPQLLAAADKFGLSALKAECEVEVAKQLSVGTAAATAVLAIKHSSSSLRQAAIPFIRAHWLQVIATQGWADALFSHPSDVVELSRLLAQLPLETSTPAAADTQPTTAATSQPQSSQGSPSAAAAPVSEPTTTAASVRHTSQAKTPATAPPPPPPPPTSPPLWSLSSEEKGRRLIEAAKEGRLGDVEALLAAEAYVGARDNRKRTSLHYAAEMGYLEMSRRLLQAGAEVDARSTVQETPLHLAVGGGHTAVVLLLLASKANPNTKDEYGFTPLHYAAWYGHAEAAGVLLKAGTHRGTRENLRRTALDIAKQRKYQDVIKVLS